jgi:hypothetical protein
MAPACRLSGLTHGEIGGSGGTRTRHNIWGPFLNLFGKRTGQTRTRLSRQTEILQRRASAAAADIWLNDQFEHSNARKLHLIILNFTYRFRWTEIPLLAHNLFKGTPAIRRPPQNKLLSAPSFVFLKNKGYAPEPLRLIEDQPNCLNPRRRCPPAWGIFRPEGQLDGKVFIFRRDLDYGCALYI